MRQSRRQRRKQPVRNAVLGLLAERPGHAYDVLKRLEDRWGPAADLNASSVYSALDSLKQDGQVRTSVREPSASREEDARTGRTVIYHITPKGVATWEDWLRAPSEIEPLRSEFALKVALSRPDDALPLRRVFDDYEQSVLDRLAEHAAAADDALELLADWRLTTAALAYQRTTRLLNAELEWVRDVRHAFEQARERSLRSPRRRGGPLGAA